MEAIEPIIKNIRDTKVKEFLATKGIKESDNRDNSNLSDFLKQLLSENRITSDEINECFFKELMYGRRQLMRIYSLKSVRKIKRLADWNELINKFDCQSIDFNRIISTTLNDDMSVRICAARTETNEMGDIRKCELLFLYNMHIIDRTDNTEENCYSYIPVVFDIKQKTLTLKVWNREEAIEGDRPTDQLDIVFSLIKDCLDFETENVSDNQQRVLYKMSKALFDDFFKNLPDIDKIERKKEDIPGIVNELLKDVPLVNIEVDNGLKTMNPEVINVDEEIYKLLQQIALYDYLQKHSISNLLQGTDRYISRIKFSDRDNLTASLTSEKGVKCIFDAKTFMCVRNSLDLVEQIVSIVVSFSKNSGKGLLSVKYDASDCRYLSIHVLKNRYYTDSDYKMIWELYKAYESEDTREIIRVLDEQSAEAM